MILITGATGFIGKNLVARLLAADQPVRVIVSPTRLHGAHAQTLPWLGTAEVVPGMLTDADVLHRALVDVHTVFHLAGAQWWGRRRDLQHVDVLSTQAIIAAARAVRVGRIVIVSHLGAAPSSAFSLLRIKGQVEELVRSSGLAYTIIRSGVTFGPDDRFVNGIATLLRANPFVYVQAGQGETLLNPLYVNDLAEALVRTLELLDTIDQTIEIGGPEYLSYNELIRTVMRVTNAPRNIVSLPPYLMRSWTSFTRRFFPHWPVTGQWYDLLASNRTAPLGTLETVFGLQPARFEDTILTYMRQRRYAPELWRAMLQRRAGHA
jgi:uncharacterized protein YbjT (DUF2867 family)